MTNLDKIDAEIAKLDAERERIQRLPPTIAVRYAAIEKKFKACEAYYRRHSFGEGPVHSLEAQHRERQADIGAHMVAGGAAILKAERERIEAQGEGMSAADKAKKLAEIGGQILRLCAQRELQMRRTEGDEFSPRPSLHAELAVFKQSAVEQLAK